MKKRLLSLVLSVFIGISLAACGGNAKEGSADANPVAKADAKSSEDTDSHQDTDADSSEEKEETEEAEEESAIGGSENVSDDKSIEDSDNKYDEETDKEQTSDEENEEYHDSIYSDHTNMKFGKFTIDGFYENKNMVTFGVEEKIIVTPKDKELIQKYGLPEDLNGYDYEIVDLGDSELICAFKSDCTCIMFDYEKMEAARVDWDTFGNHMFNMDYSHYDEESGEYILEDGALRQIWAYYSVDEDGFMTNIEEVYIP